MKRSSADFRQASAEAVKNERVIAAVRRTADILVKKRAEAVAGRPGYEETRARAKERRREADADREKYIALFKKNAEKRGAVVHEAVDAAEARAIAVGLAREYGIRTAVKSKSMTAEEIGLNEALEEAGVEVTETDLGEFIIQVANEPPSHIMAPAIHKSRAEVAALFAHKLGSPPDLDVEGLVAVARRHLREKFLNADLGITGCNFAIAETGTAALVTNEGNGRMCTTLPRVQLVLAGIDKVLPSLSDLPDFLMLLTHSASGQKISTYFSLTTGPRRAGEEEGPEKLHIILLDNGRRRIGGGPYGDMLHCLHCGACLSHCPVYRAIGGHAYNAVYPGPMGSVLSPLISGRERYPDLPSACTLCGRCGEICPASIPLPDYLRRLRGETKPVGAAMSLGASLAAKPYFYRKGLGLVRALLKGRIAAGPLAEWKKVRELPSPEEGEPFRDWWKAEENKP